MLRNMSLFSDFARVTASSSKSCQAIGLLDRARTYGLELCAARLRRGMTGTADAPFEGLCGPGGSEARVPRAGAPGPDEFCNCADIISVVFVF